jgi:branched-chain amino acid transport system ATP-binding protein
VTHARHGAPPVTAAAALEVRDLVAGYDQADVLAGVSLTVAPGEITCLLGANGAGKTTLVRAILGLTPPRAGEIRLDGMRIDGLPPHRIAALGVGAIPEGRRVFPRLTVRENLLTGAWRVRDRAAIQRALDAVHEAFPRLREREGQLAGTLSGGEQAMLSIGRGLMGEPRLLVIDEPSLGLSPRFVKDNFAIIAGLRSRGIGILLVEQNVHQTLAIAACGYVLQGGRVVAAGSSEELRHHPALLSAYFG